MALVIRPLKHSSSNNNNDNNNKSNQYNLLHVYYVLGTVLRALNGLCILILTKNLSGTMIISILQIGKLSLRLSNMLSDIQLNIKPFLSNTSACAPNHSCVHITMNMLQNFFYSLLCLVTRLTDLICE